MRKRYNTPHRSRVVKTRMTEEEYAEFAERLSACNMSQAEFIRQAITGAAIRPIITVSPVNDELLAAVGKLTAEYGRIGGKYDLTNAEKDGIGDSSYVSTGVYDEAGVNNVLLRQRWLPGASRFHVGKLSEGG